MKSKLCWIPFTVFTLAAIVPLVLENFSVIKMQNNFLSYIAVFAILAMFAVNIIFVAIDRKTSPVYLLSRNIPAAVFAMIAAALIASKSSLNVILNLQGGSFNPFVLAVSVFGMLTAVCFVVIALAHIQGRNFLPRMGIFFLSMPVWGGLMLISEFLDNRIVSVNVIDPLLLFAYAFMLIYLFKLSMVITTVNGKNPVKAMYLYGFPLAGLGIAIGVNGFCSIASNGLDYSENIVQLSCLAVAFYIILLNVELTRFSKTTEEQLVKFDLDDYDEKQSIYGEYGTHDDEVIVKSDIPTKDYDYDYSYATVEADSFVTAPDKNYTKDYDYGTEGDGDLVIAPDTEGDDAIYVDSDVAGSFEEGVVKSNEDARSNAEVSQDDETMAKIDKLIADINQ